MQWLIGGIKKRPKLKEWSLAIIGTFRKSYMLLANKVIGINRNKIVFISFDGKSYSDNPKAISEKLHELYPKFEIVWIFNNLEGKRKIVPDYVRCVKRGSYRALKELATAKFWVDNFCKSIDIYKCKKQVYIQTWHGDRGFKKILYDSTFISNRDKYIEEDICDLAVSGSDFADRVYKTAFNYNGEILKVGCPRNDMLIKNDSRLKDSIRRFLNIEQKVKILLYAPTLRREASNKKTTQSLGNIDLQVIINEIEKNTNKPWICFLRAHSAVAGLSNIPKGDKFIDVSSYEDMSDLLMISDMLITDYSSSAGDFALLHRPIILFQNDREVFIKNDRALYFDIDESPFIIAKCEKDIIDIVGKLNRDLAYQNCKDILEFYGTNETGRAAEELVKYIISKINV